MQNTYGEYTNLNLAKAECKKDSQCIGIYEASCHKNGPFTLIKHGFVTSVFGTNCLYKKKQYGKVTLYGINNELKIASNRTWMSAEFYTCIYSKSYIKML